MPTPNPAFIPPAPTTTRPDLAGTFGMVASTHWIATATAQSVLERGGNAFDAAVAGAFVLHVVEPHLNGPAATSRRCSRPRTTRRRPCSSARGPPRPVRHRSTTAPRGSTSSREPVPSPPPCRVPWTPGSCCCATTARGSSPTSSHRPSATRGTATRSHRRWSGRSRRCAGCSRSTGPTSAAQWLPGGTVPAPGDVVRNEALASVFERLVAAGSGVDGRSARIDAARGEWAEASSPRRSTGSSASRTATRPGPTTPA